MISHFDDWDDIRDCARFLRNTLEYAAVMGYQVTADSHIAQEWKFLNARAMFL